MTLDEGFVSNREAVQRGHDEDEHRRFADWQEQRMLESDEAEASRWSHLMARAAAERPVTWYDDKPGYDRRLYAVDGLVDEAPVERMPTWLGDAS